MFVVPFEVACEFDQLHQLVLVGLGHAWQVLLLFKIFFYFFH
jgi:hypothetical protein